MDNDTGSAGPEHTTPGAQYPSAGGGQGWPGPTAPGQGQAPWTPPPSAAPGTWPHGPAPAGPPLPPRDPRPSDSGNHPDGPNRKWPVLVGACVGFAALLVGSAVAGGEIVAHRNPTTVVAASENASAASSQAAASEPLAKVAASVMPSVVSILVTSSSQSDEGSGVILRSDGVILTNNHVVAAAAGGNGTVRVTFSNGKTVQAHIIGRDPADDLAVIQAQGVSGLTPATLGSSQSLHVGDTVLAIGSPLGLEGSVTAGIVSALHRVVNVGAEQQPQPQQNPFGFSEGQPQQGTTDAVLSEAIQTDAAINPGNSGGALVDDQGRVVGINSAIATVDSSSLGNTQSGSIGVGFAIPIDEAANIARQLMNGETPRHALLGVEVGSAPSGGAIVESTTTSGPAAKAGLRAGDVITQVGSTPISSSDELIAAIRSHKPGEQVTITYRRDGSLHTAEVTLASATG